MTLPFAALTWLFTLALWTLLRLTLILISGITTVEFKYLPAIFLRGLWFDLHVLLLLSIPYFILKLVLPPRWLLSRTATLVSRAFLFTWVFLWFFASASEIVFWNEFASRANFIAVDYLVYTQEVIGNIKESYPLATIIFVLLALSAVTTYLLVRFVKIAPYEMNKNRRIRFALVLFLIVPISIKLHSLDQFEIPNSFANESSNNGTYSLFAAYYRNELQYSRFYKTLPQSEADSTLKQLGVAREPMSDFKNNPRPIPDTHEPNEMGPFRRAPKNVILITVESLSADYLGLYGNKKHLTPHLDQLAKDGYWFSHMFATGTRTVRGLEALSLGIPPVPGQAVVRRPNSDHLVTIGEMLQKQGVATFFFYGGYGYFDNMNDYFMSNDYEVLDRNSFDQKSITFSNVWGVADEILFSNTARLLTEKTKGRSRFFAQIMTTSNHRPYTYPDGRIDIPSPGGRDGAVKYTDFAIGRFIEDAKKEPWFKDTVFVIVADHCASVAGKTKLPVANYLIPMIMYAPDIITPGVYDRMVSQIDIAPTLIDIMKLHGDDFFFGESLFENSDRPARAFISNYQELGYYKDNVLTVLKPKQRVEAFRVEPKTYTTTPIPVREDLEKEAISFYQTADLSLRLGALKFHESDVELK